MTDDGSERASAQGRRAGTARRIFDHADVDRVMAVLLALVSEVASIRDRLDTHERIVAGGAQADHEAVERYLPDTEVENARETWRDAYIRRLFRVFTEDRDGFKTQIAGYRNGSLAEWTADFWR